MLDTEEKEKRRKRRSSFSGLNLIFSDSNKNDLLLFHKAIYAIKHMMDYQLINSYLLLILLGQASMVHAGRAKIDAKLIVCRVLKRELCRAGVSVK